jgi:hypothetical protein
MHMSGSSDRACCFCTQAQLLSTWFTSSGASSLMTLSKLWLFNNALGDDAAPALATLIAAR